MYDDALGRKVHKMQLVLCRRSSMLNKKVIIFCLLVLFALLVSEKIARSDEIEFIDQYMRESRVNMDSETTEWYSDHLIPALVGFADHYHIDPLLAAVLAYTEGSWNPDSLGKDGEIGVLQVLPHWYETNGYSEVSPGYLTQIDTGLWLLRRCIDHCKGSILGGLTIYHMGSHGTCSKPSKRALYKFKLYNQLKRRYYGK